MRIISLSIRRLRLYFLDNPLVSSLYILSGVVSILLILMLYPYVMPHMQRYSEANQSYRYFRYILDEESTDYQGLYEIVNDVDTYEITLSNYESSISHTEDSFELMTAISLGDSRVQNFKTSDLAQSLEENEIMAPENTTSIASDEGSANTVKLGADDPFSYTIRDRWNDSRYLIHPETFQSRYGFTFISFYIEEPATPEYVSKLNERFQTIFPVSNIRSPIDVYRAEDDEAPFALLFMAVIYVLAIISFAYLLDFLIASQERTNSIFRIVGMSKLQVRLVQAVDVILTTLLSALLGVVIHRLAWKTVFQPLLFKPVEKLQGADYLTVIFMAIAISLLILIPYAMTSHRGPIKERKDD